MIIDTHGEFNENEVIHHQYLAHKLYQHPCVQVDKRFSEQIFVPWRTDTFLFGHLMSLSNLHASGN